MNEFMDEGGYEDDIDSVSTPLNFAMGGPVEAMHLSPYTPTNQESGDYQDMHSMPMTYAYGGEVAFGDYSQQRPAGMNARQMLQRFADGGVVSRETGSPFNLNPFGPGAGVPDAAFRGSSAYSQLPVVTPSSTPLTVPQETASMFQQKAGITPSAQQLQYWSGVFGADNQVTPDEVARFDQALLNTGKTPMAYVPNSTVELQDRFGPMSMMTGGTGTGASWQAPTVTTRPPTLINPDMSKLSASQQYARDLAAQDAITAKTRSQITDLYTSTLKRDPDRAGMDYWMRTIGADNVITPEEIAKFNAAAQGELGKSTVTGGTGNDTVSGGTVNQQGVVNAVNNAVNAGGTMGAEKATTAGTTAAPVFEYFNNTPEQNAKIREMLTGENDYARGQLMELYAETFGRVPDTAGFNYWLNTIGKDNILTKDEIAQWNANAQKEVAQMDQLKGLYSKYLQREPDEAGRAYWMGQIAAAGGVNSGIESLFQQGANQEVSMGNAGYRPGMYTQIGSRETPEAVAQLEAQAPFRFGPNEYAREQLLELYTDVLGRPIPDQEGFNWWLQNYGSDNRISKEEENLFIEAAQRELAARKAQGGLVKKADGGEDLTPMRMAEGGDVSREAAVRKLYQDVLGRAADDAGLQYYTTGEGKQYAAAQLADMFGASREGQIQKLYQNILGRSTDPRGMEYYLSGEGRALTPDQIAEGFRGSEEYKNKQGLVAPAAVTTTKGSRPLTREGLLQEAMLFGGNSYNALGAYGPNSLNRRGYLTEKGRQQMINEIQPKAVADLIMRGQSLGLSPDEIQQAVQSGWQRGAESNRDFVVSEREAQANFVPEWFKIASALAGAHMMGSQILNQGASAFTPAASGASVSPASVPVFGTPYTGMELGKIGAAAIQGYQNPSRAGAANIVNTVFPSPFGELPKDENVRFFKQGGLVQSFGKGGAVKKAAEMLTEVVKPAARSEATQKRFYPSMVDLGYTRIEDRASPRMYADKGGEQFLTFEKDGVRAALSSNNILYLDQKGRVSTGYGEPNESILRALIVDPEVRKQGKAKAAMQEIIDLADQTGTTLYLEPAPIEGGKMSAAQLTQFYKQFGFAPADGKSDKVLVRTNPVKRAAGSPEYGEIAIGGGVTPDTKTALTTKQGFSGKEAMDFVKRVYGEGASNLESAVRGSVAAIPGAFGDIESIFRDDKNRKLATTEEILRDRMPKRLTAPTKEAAGFEEVGTYLPLPIPAGTATQVAKTAGKGVETGAAKMLEKLGPRQGRKWESVIASMEPARFYAVKPKGGTFYPPESGSNLDEYLDNTVRSLSTAPNLSGKDAKVVAQFIRDKGRKYLTTVYGTADDPLRQALMEGRLPRYDSDKERFRGYALDAARAGNPEAVEDLEKAYDNATRLQTLGYMSPSSTENTFTIGNRMDEAVRQKLLAEGVPEELINTSYPTTQSSETMRGAYSDSRKKLGQLLGAMEQASPAAFDTEGKLRQAFIRGIGESDKGNEALLYAATKEEPIYDISSPSMDYMKAGNLAKAIATIPVNELERMTFPEAVVKGTQNMKFEKDWQLSIQKARDGKPVPKEIYFRGTQPVYEISKNLQWVRVMSPDAVELEGAAMRHSIGGYKTSTNYNLGGKDAFNSGLARVYSLRDEKGVPQVTVEAKFTDDDGLEIRQIRSKFNSEPTQEEKSAIYQLFDTLGPREIRSTNYLTDRTGKELTDSVSVNWGDLYQSYLDYKNQAQGFSKGGVVKKAAEMLKNLGAKEEKLASKDLTTLQDFHTSLGDSVRERAARMQQQMDAMKFKYEPGQYVFTEGSAKKNLPPYKILGKTMVGNNPVREPHPDHPLMGKVVKDPVTGKTVRTPYEPGYKVRQERGPDDWAEFNIPESAIKGAVDKFAKGGAANKASTTDFIKTANARL